MGRVRTTAPVCPQRGTGAYNGSAGTPIRHTARTDSARTKYGLLVRSNYGLLAPMGTVVNSVDTGDLGSVDVHGGTRRFSG